MKFRIINSKDGRWGEGWKNGDIVDMDWAAAKVALEVGEIEIYEENSNGFPVRPEESYTGSVAGPQDALDRPVKKSRRVRKAVGA